MVRVQRPTEQFKLRLPRDVRQALEKQAKEGKRSLTSQIVLMLESCLSAGECYPDHLRPRVVPVGEGSQMRVAEASPEELQLERELAERIRLLPASKKRALLALLRED